MRKFVSGSGSGYGSGYGYGDGDGSGSGSGYGYGSGSGSGNAVSSGQTEFEYQHQAACGYVRDNLTYDAGLVDCKLCINFMKKNSANSVYKILTGHWPK